MNKLSLGARIMADTDPFLKVLQILAFLVLVAASVLTNLKVGTPEVHQLMATIGFVTITVAQFSVKASAMLAANGFTAATIDSLIPDGAAALAAVKAEVKSPAPLPGLTDSLADAVNLIDPDAKLSPEDISKQIAEASAVGNTKPNLTLIV